MREGKYSPLIFYNVGAIGRAQATPKTLVATYTLNPNPQSLVCRILRRRKQHRPRLEVNEEERRDIDAIDDVGAIDNVGAIAQAQATAAAPPKPASMFNLFKKAPLGQEV